MSYMFVRLIVLKQSVVFPQTLYGAYDLTYENVESYA